jgi:hypothetical protein
MEHLIITAEQYKKFQIAGVDMAPFKAVGKLPETPEIEVKFERPPNYAEIVKVFPAVKLRRGVIFTYGKTIYNPDRTPLTRALRAHEEVHSKRQSVEHAHALGPEKWWELYLKEKDFRLAEELIAHQVEYMIAAEGVGRQLRRRTLAQIAARLSGPIYGRMVSLDEAKNLLVGNLAIVGAKKEMENVAPV